MQDTIVIAPDYQEAQSTVCREYSKPRLTSLGGIPYVVRGKKGEHDDGDTNPANLS